MMEFHISANDGGQRADRFIVKACPKLPKNLLYKAFRKEDIKRNGKRCKPEEILQEGDCIRVYLPADCLEQQPTKVLHTELPPPAIVYEDDTLCLMHKPVGLPVHPDDHGTEDTLVARFLADLARRGCYDPRKEQSFTPALCNRLDRNTEGLVIGAKTAAALRCINEKIRLGEITKEYLCITVGAPPKSTDTVIAYHRKEEGNRVRLESKPFAGCKETKTEYTVLAKKDGLALVQVRLFTGRTHQIRAQMAVLGCPILGDGAYGNKETNHRYGEHFQLLTACRLVFALDTNTPCAISHLAGKAFSITPAFCSRYFPSIRPMK